MLVDGCSLGAGETQRRPVVSSHKRVTLDLWCSACHDAQQLLPTTDGQMPWMLHLHTPEILGASLSELLASCLTLPSPITSKGS